MHRGLIAASLLAVTAVAAPALAGVVYSENFSRADSSAAWGTATVGSAWSYASTGQSGTGTGPAVNQNITDGNDFNIAGNIGTFEAGGVAGSFYALQGFAALTLGGAGKTATWGFNGRYDRGNYLPLDWNETSTKRGGFGMILAASGADLTAAGAQGYALVTRMTDLAQANTNTLQLIRFSGPFGNQANWTTLATFTPALIGNNSGYYLSAKVDFDGSTNTWSLLAATNSSSFTDPLTLTGAALTAVDGTYASTAMTNSGVAFFTSGSTANDYRFDNLSFSQVVPEPTSLALLSLAASAMLMRHRSR